LLTGFLKNFAKHPWHYQAPNHCLPQSSNQRKCQSHGLHGTLGVPHTSCNIQLSHRPWYLPIFFLSSLTSIIAECFVFVRYAGVTQEHMCGEFCRSTIFAVYLLTGNTASCTCGFTSCGVTRFTFHFLHLRPYMYKLIKELATPIFLVSRST